jgi:hypothetical protein
MLQSRKTQANNESWLWCCSLYPVLNTARIEITAFWPGKFIRTITHSVHMNDQMAFDSQNGIICELLVLLIPPKVLAAFAGFEPHERSTEQQ